MSPGGLYIAACPTMEYGVATGGSLGGFWSNVLGFSCDENITVSKILRPKGKPSFNYGTLPIHLNGFGKVYVVSSNGAQANQSRNTP
jgi:hypothetical protein